MGLVASTFSENEGMPFNVAGRPTRQGEGFVRCRWEISGQVRLPLPQSCSLGSEAEAEILQAPPHPYVTQKGVFYRGGSFALLTAKSLHYLYTNIFP